MESSSYIALTLTTRLNNDLADHTSTSSKVKTALAMYQGRVDILINNGGVSTRAMARKALFDVDSFAYTIISGIHPCSFVCTSLLSCVYISLLSNVIIRVEGNWRAFVDRCMFICNFRIPPQHTLIIIMYNISLL